MLGFGSIAAVHERRVSANAMRWHPCTMQTIQQYSEGRPTLGISEVSVVAKPCHAVSSTSYQACSVDEMLIGSVLPMPLSP